MNRKSHQGTSFVLVATIVERVVVNTMAAKHRDARCGLAGPGVRETIRTIGLMGALTRGG
jgi:hypothetical protein